MRTVGRSIATAVAAVVLAGTGVPAVAQDRWPGREGELQVEPLPELPPDYRGPPAGEYRGPPEGEYRGPPEGEYRGAEPRGSEYTPPGDADYGEFHEGLRPHGEWVEHPRYGGVWVPYAQEQEPDWRPYTRGQWVLTDEHGWYWESDEPFGWATYHYGRWAYDDAFGWLWVPGSVWGPAWVAWRESDDAIGWVPLPPEAEWYPDRGIVYRSGSYLDSPRYAALWVFVGASALLAPRVYRHFYPRTRNTFYIGRTRHVTAYQYSNRFVFNRGISPRIVERRIGRPVPVLPIRPVGTSRDSRFTGSQRSFVGVYRPNIAPRTDGRPVSRPPFAVDRQPVRGTPPNADPRRFDPSRPVERDRGLPRPTPNREPWRDPRRPPEAAQPVPRPSPSPNFDPRFGSRPPSGAVEPRRIEEQRRPPTEVRRPPSPDVRRIEEQRRPPAEVRRVEEPRRERPSPPPGPPPRPNVSQGPPPNAAPRRDGSAPPREEQRRGGGEQRREPPRKDNRPDGGPGRGG